MCFLYELVRLNFVGRTVQYRFFWDELLKGFSVMFFWIAVTEHTDCTIQVRIEFNRKYY